MSADGRSEYRDDVQLRIRERLEAVAVVQPIPPRRGRDWALAVVLALLTLPFLPFEDSVPTWAHLVPAMVAVAFIPFRRQMPLIAIVSVDVVAAVCLAVALRDLTVEDAGSPAGLAGVLLVYSLCRWATPQHVAIGFVASAATAATVEWSADDLRLDDWLFVVPWLVVGGFALAMRYRARLVDDRNKQIRLTERNALARELHDTVAHHVSAIAVQAQAGQYVAATNPEAAADALRSIEKIANDSIDEMRRMVGILRSDDDHARTVSADSLDVLADPTGRPGVHITGDPRLDDLPAGVGAALFRIAQESITNARRHSRDVTFVDVAVTRHDDVVEMVVDNDGVPTTRNSGSGYGQIGMRERVEALGGTFESEARPAAGWRTSTSIPLGRVDS